MAHSDELTRPVRPDGEHPALREFRRRGRRSTARYAAVIVVLVVAGFVAVRIAYDHGELNTVTSVTAPPPAAVAEGTLSRSASAAWSAGEQPAVGQPYNNGIVVTWTGHTVNGRDALTGVVRWHYSKSDETLCAAVQQDATTIALYRRDGNCDQVTGIVTATGEPKWWRTLTDDGPLDLSSTSNVVLAVSATSVHDFDNFGGLDRWTYAPPAGCRIDRALGGSKGVLISYHCGAKYHLTMHELTSNSDKQTFDVAVDQPYVPVAAGTTLAVASSRSGTVVSVNAKDGSIGAALEVADSSTVLSAVKSLPRSQTTVESTSDDGKAFELIRLGGEDYALDSDGATVWHAPAAGPASADGKQVILVTGTSVQQRDLSTGSITLTTNLSPTPGRLGGSVSGYQIGGGVLLAGTTAAYYR